MKNEIFRERRRLEKNRPTRSFFEIQHTNSLMYDYSFPLHYHDWYEFYYLKSGSCTYIIDNKKYEMSPGSWVIVPPDIKHKIYYDRVRHERILIYFTKDYMYPSMMDNMAYIMANPVYVPESKEKCEMENLAQRLIEEGENRDELSVQMCKNLVFELMSYYIRKPTAKKRGQDTDVVIDYVIKYVKGNYGENITLEALADYVNLSKSHLSRKFKHATGTNLKDYIKAVRINNAKIMLVETDRSISQISEKCGFGDSNYFSYVFNKEVGIPPLKYRKQHS